MYNCCYENKNDHNDIQQKAPQLCKNNLKPQQCYHEMTIKYKMRDTYNIFEFMMFQYNPIQKLK